MITTANKTPSLLIADSGSTKTDWLLLLPDGNSAVKRVTTQGLNPYQMGAEAIAVVLTDELLKKMPEAASSRVYFYGAGCRNEGSELMKSVLTSLLSPVSVEVESDMLGAARALFGHGEGIACILGTGANSCLYDGSSIVRQVPALGYVLGDEGSGAVLGKRLLADVFKQQLPAEIADAFRRSYPAVDVPAVLNRVYREPLANRYMASFVPFLHEHRTHSAVRHLLLDEFRRFLRRNVAPYDRGDLEVGFLGSVAYYFLEELRDAAAEENVKVGKVLRSPLEGLAQFHGG